MTIKIGEKIPYVTLKQFVDHTLKDQETDEIFKGKKVVLFGVVGAFTPTCSGEHMPGYIKLLNAFKALGIGVACMSVNDPFVMRAWAATLPNRAEGITMIADGNATLAKALWLEMDASEFGMGIRNQRFALYAEDGEVKALAVEKPGAFGVSSAESMLETIKGLKSAA